MLLPAADVAADGLDVALLGIPYDGGVSYRTGARFGPARCASSPRSSGPGIPCSRCTPSSGCGWPTAATSTSCRSRSSARTRRSSRRWHRWWRREPVRCASGAITRHAAAAALAGPTPRPAGLVHFDAHPDTWDEYFGSKLLPRHAVPSRHRGGHHRPKRDDPGRHPRPALRPRGLRLPRRARPRGAAHRAVKERGWPGWPSACARLRGMPLYCSFDIDAVRSGLRAGHRHARGGRAHLVRGARPGARAARDSTLVGADVVEVSPPYDGPGQITSLLAANLALRDPRCARWRSGE